MQLSWAGKGILAVATGEPHIRLWDLDRGDNYAVRLDGHYFSDKDAVMSLAYCPGKGEPKFCYLLSQARWPAVLLPIMSQGGLGGILLSTVPGKVGWILLSTVPGKVACSSATYNVPRKVGWDSAVYCPREGWVGFCCSLSQGRLGGFLLPSTLGQV